MQQNATWAKVDSDRCRHMLSKDLSDNESTLVQVMDWCHQATSHYLSQSWPSCMSPHIVTKPQRVNKYPTRGVSYTIAMQKRQPLSETMMVTLLTHICVTGPQWVNFNPACISNYNHYKEWHEITHQFQASTVQPLKFENGLFRPTLHRACDYLSMLGLKLFHVSKMGPSRHVLERGPVLAISPAHIFHKCLKFYIILFAPYEFLTHRVKYLVHYAIFEQSEMRFILPIFCSFCKIWYFLTSKFLCSLEI